MDASRVDAILQGLAHRQQAGISMHASKMQELDSQIADVDQKLAAQTRMLLSINEETGQAQKDEMVLKAEWEELSAGLQAYEAENKALHSSLEQSKQELRGTEDEEHRIKQAFLHACSLLNANFRNIQEEHSGEFFDNVEKSATPDEEEQTPAAKPSEADEAVSDEED